VKYVLLLRQPWAMAISRRSSLVYLNVFSCNPVAINLSCFSCQSTSHRFRSNHNTAVAAARNQCVLRLESAAEVQVFSVSQ
jgi:hypothetical protein